ncbi:MAG: carbamoyltransferase C-terminal domain-containing protein, partial [Terriglobales bacterium]
ENDKLERDRSRNRPEAAIQSCFESAGTSWDGIDGVAVASRPFHGWSRKSLLRTRLSALGPAASAYYGVNELGVLARELNDLRVLRRYATGSGHKIFTFDHHFCHAAGAFYPSPFDRALIVTMDEDGDGNSGMLGVGEGNRIRVLRTIAFPHSLAWVFSQITDLVGFRPHREEHKTQWLSLDSEPIYKDALLKMLRARGGSIPRLDYRFFNHGLAGQLSFSEKFYRTLGLPADPRQLDDSQRKGLASSMQAACAEVVNDIVEDLRRREGIQEVCFSGGLFQNVLLVASLEKHLGLSQVFVPPAPGNAGTSLGAARLLWHQVLQKPRCTAAPHAYLGPKFDRHAIRDVLENSKNRYIFSNTEERKLDVGAQLLQAGKIVAWFQGAAEFGPRALGNRSVLASPWAAYVKENLNDFIKHREWFRPFAISVPEEDCERYFEASPQCRFMNSVGTVRPGTECLPESFLLPNRQVRLHIVERRSNPAFWSLLKRFGEEAPAPMLLNTSFNLFGEPLVVTPRDAMRSYFSSGLDALIMDRFILSKTALPVSTATMSANRVGLGA